MAYQPRYGRAREGINGPLKVPLTIAAEAELAPTAANKTVLVGAIRDLF